MTYQEIEIKHLERSPLNVRKTEPKAAMDELKASILAHGLMQNLVVVPAKKKGRYAVIAGGRRFEALTQLRDEGKLPDDYAPTCRIADPAEAAELSLAENTVRQAMHPADEFEAFADLIEKGQTTEQIAQRFGVTKRVVEGRMKLARVAPDLIKAYREAKLTLESLMAFTVTDDHQKQLTVFADLNDWDDPSDIRAALTEETVDAKSKMAQFVTLETYLAAGGTTRTDLFGDDIYIENPELLDALVSEKLKLVEKELAAEGWKWVEVARERDWNAIQGCTRLKPETADAPEALLMEMTRLEAEQIALGEQLDATEDDDEIDRLNDSVSKLEDRLDQLADQIAGYARFTPEQVAAAGCYAYVGHDGELEVEKGLLRRDEAKKPAVSADADDDGRLPPEKPKGIPESLKRDLEAYRLGVAQAAIASNPPVAFDLLVFKAAKAVCSISHAYDGPQISFSEKSCGNASSEARGFIQERMDAIEKTLPLDWQEADNEAEQFAAFQALSDYQKQSLLAFCVARTLKPKLDSGREPTAYDIALFQTGVNVADHWRPAVANYLGRITKAPLLELGEFLFGSGSMTRWANAKTSEIREMLGRGFKKPEADDRPDVVARLRSWLPEGMAFRVIAPKAEAVTVPKKGRKAKQAA